MSKNATTAKGGDGDAGPRRPTLRFLLASPWHLIALGAGSGLPRVAPGTWATLFAWLMFLWIDQWLDSLGWWLLSPFGEFTLPPWADGVRLGTLIVGAAVLWIGGGSYDLRRLAGVAQLRETPDAQDPDDEPLRIEGIQRHVRHPLYLGTLLVVWGLAGSPFGLCTAIGATVYILVGIRYEERDLVRRFGDRYGDYRRRVPMLFPWPGRHA